MCGYSQLTTFFEDWEIRNYSTPINVTQSTEIASNSTVNINVNLSNQIGNVLPTHFGTNLTHFLGESSLNETDFMDNLNNLGDVFFRYPGGNGSNQFFWDGNVPSSILNDDQITVNDLIDGTGWRISPDEFSNVLIQTNSQGIIAVNASYARYGTAPNATQVAAGYAADFVRHMNNNLNANIKYWEVGNENYGPWQAGHTVNGIQISGTDYGNIFNVFVDSMKAADPTIKIGAVIFPHDGVYNNWSRNVLQKVQNTADYLIIHDYFKRKNNPNNVTYDEMMISVDEVQQDVNNVNNMVTSYTSKPSNYYPIAMTEYNSKTGEREISMANAIFIARVLAEQIKHQIGMSLIWSFQNGLDSHGGDHGITARNSTIVPKNTPRPVYFVYRYINQFFGDKMFWSYSSDTSINSYVTKFDNGDLGMMVVNHTNQSKIIEYNFGSYNLKDNFYWYELYATDETDKKVFINGITSNLLEGGPSDYAQVPAFTRLVNSNTKFEIKPYSVNFIANSNSTVDIGDYDNIVMNFNNPFKDFLTFSEIKNFKKITILNLNGIPILESYSRTIDTSKISPGIYFILLESDGYQSVYKSVKI
tara:strand:+ start:134 stop:1897 length:1764 start_codon:yes stop_codon:yes gene_type:complete